MLVEAGFPALEGFVIRTSKQRFSGPPHRRVPGSPGRRLGVLWLASLLLAAPAGAASTRGSSPIDLIEQGLEAFLERRYDDSIRFFERALQLDRRNETARQGLLSARRQNEILLGQQRVRERQAIQSAREYMGRENWVEAYDRLRSVLDKNPDHRKAQSMLKKVRRKVEKSHARAKPQTNDWFYTKGVLAYLRGDWYEAANTWEYAYTFNPDLVFLAAKIDKAKKNLDEQQKQERLQLYQSVAWDNLQQGQYEQAIKAWQDLLALDPENAEAKEGIEQAREAASKDRVRRRAQEVQQLTQKAMDAYIERDYPASLALWQEVLEIEPDNSLAKDYIQRVEGRKTAHVPSSLPRSSYSAAPVVSGYQKGLTLFREERYPEAIEALERHLAKNPDDPKAQETLKEIETRQQTLAEKAYQAGLVAYSQGRLPDAIKQWQGALRVDPDYQKARQALIKALAEAKRS